MRARLRRQQILYEPGRTIEILVAESALGMPVCGPHAMIAQIDCLMSAVGLPAVRLGILPMYVVYPNLLPNGYWGRPCRPRLSCTTGGDKSRELWEVFLTFLSFRTEAVRKVFYRFQ